MKKTLLVVDDSSDIAESTAMTLELLGYKVRTAGNGREAVMAVLQDRPDVVFLDLNMPVLDGYHAAQAIRALFPQAPPLLVAVSAMASAATAAKILACGFDHYVTKPAELDKLLRFVEGAPDAPDVSP
jgi:CheY-like chemotaxis protein